MRHPMGNASTGAEVFDEYMEDLDGDAAPGLFKRRPS